MYLHKTPKLFNFLYPQLTWQVETDEKEVFLTFDDGPVPGPTNFVLDQLNKFNFKATFFCVGDNVAKHPKIAEQIVDEGHRLANHTFNHLAGWDTADNTYLSNIAQCEVEVAKYEGKTDERLFRPPYGKIKRSQIKAVLPTHNIVMWTLLSGDFDEQLSVNRAFSKLKKHTKRGSIVLFHDSIKAEGRLVALLPAYLEFLKSEEFNCKIL